MPESMTHHYQVSLRWTGNRGRGTDSYGGYGRDHEVSAADKAPIAGSSDPAYRGDVGRWNPEELVVSAVAQCHMLWYLHLASEAGVAVTAYVDHPVGILVGTSDGVGQFSEVTLRPEVTVVASSMSARALTLHDDVGAKCAVARSMAFPVRHQPVVRVGGSL